MGFLWFGKKRDELKEIRESFENIKQDMMHISGWIKHLNAKNKHLEASFEHLSEEILKIKEDIDDIKSGLLMLKTIDKRRVFKHQQTGVYKQTGVQGVQTRVQTGVQTPLFDEILKNLTSSERVIVWILLNSDLKLSCEDLAALLGKQKNTIRGQINSIKQKSESLLEEVLEKNGKKRYYINEKVREILMRSLKKKAKQKRKSESS
ncbi:MAG: hypothetical protein QXI41_01360 [Candidatus Pacearchaeota archaeon]